MACTSPLIIALDYPDMNSALAIADRLDPALCRLKVGKELFTSAGPQVVEKLQGKGFDIFLDLKFHDIPNTTSKAVKVAAELGVWMVNVHASGGRRMMAACRNALDNSTLAHKPLLIAVTVLTSMSTADLVELGIDLADQQVLKLASLAQQSGMDGVVCSAMEAPLLKSELGAGFQLITPGIRPEGFDRGDQRRIVTPTQAMRNGSDFLVIGRPVTQASNPVTVLNTIVNSL